MVGRRFFSLVGAIPQLSASFLWKHHRQPMFMHHNWHSSSETWQYFFQPQKEFGASCCWSLVDVRLSLTMEAVCITFHSGLIVPVIASFILFFVNRTIVTLSYCLPFSPLTHFFCWSYR